MWSPVIITVFIPALLHSAMASFTPSLGGSIIPIKPQNVKLFSIFVSILLGKKSMSLYATAITRRAFLAILLFCISIFVIS